MFKIGVVKAICERSLVPQAQHRIKIHEFISFSVKCYLSYLGGQIQISPRSKNGLPLRQEFPKFLTIIFSYPPCTPSRSLLRFFLRSVTFSSHWSLRTSPPCTKSTSKRKGFVLRTVFMESSQREINRIYACKGNFRQKTTKKTCP